MAHPIFTSSLTALALCVGLAPPLRAEWRRIDSPNFVVIGDASARDLRDLAVKFEAFRETLSRVLTARAISTAVPTVVIVFPTDRAFTPFKPRFQGKPIEVGGLFVPRQDINYIAIVSDGEPRRLPIIFHEYSHLVTSNAGREVPVWLGEGLAEYYSTFELSRDGREALLGLVPEDRLAHLNDALMLPLEVLLTVDHDSPLYNESNRRSTFYAQAWALTHMILLGKQDRTKQLDAYLDHLSNGVPAKQAWQQAFGSQDLGRELESYVRQRAFRATRYRFTEKVAAFTAPVVTMAPAEVQAFLAEFLIHQRRLDEAGERIAAATKADPSNARLRITSAALEIARDDYLAAGNHLRALDTPTEWLGAYLAGVAIADLAESERPNPERLETARRYFGAARASWPEFPNALARLVDIELRSPAVPAAEARAAIERARALAPGRHEYALLHAQLLARQSEFSASRQVLGPLMSNRYPAEVREAARGLMARIVEVETSRLARSGGLSAGTSAGVPAGVDTPGFPTPGIGRPIFRQLRPGEQRFEGVLERIDCSASGAAFHVKTPDGPATVTTIRLDDVDFISYRNDLTGNIECGPMKQPMPVLVTWRPAPDGAGGRHVVAIEFLRREPKQAG